MNNMHKKIRINMKDADSDTAYIALPGHPEQIEPGVVKKTISLDDIIDDYMGPRIYLDFNKDGKLIGIEILA